MNTAIVIPARRHGRAWAWAAALAVLLAGGPVDANPRTETIRGPAIVLDGDTLLVAGRKVRLMDADAFEAHTHRLGDDPGNGTPAVRRSRVVMKVHAPTHGCHVVSGPTQSATPSASPCSRIARAYSKS